METPTTKRRPAGTKSIVDRSVVLIVPNPDDTPSFRNGVTPDVERKHRLYGTSLLSAVCTLLKSSASTYATSCTIFHRFYHRVSLTTYCVWTVAMSSLLLATKVEDGAQQRNVRTIILTFDHLYRKRRGCTADCPEDKRVLPMPKLGPVWKEYYERIIDMEHRILRELGFSLYWIPDSHPHKFLGEFMRLLFGSEDQGPNINDDETSQNDDIVRDKHHSKLAQRAWNYCNDSYRMDLCVRFEPEISTCAAVFLAALDLDVVLPTEPRPWWELFLETRDGTDNTHLHRSGQEISTVANAILGMQEYERVDPSYKTFLPSLVDGGSFNDPDSFIYESRS